MGFYTHKTPFFLKWLYPEAIWNVAVNEKILFLTFDDGPIPEITEFVLEELRKYEAKGTFFCVGDNIRKNPQIFKRILEEGHSVGNHTYNHIKGSISDNDSYFRNIELWENEANNYLKQPNYLFRPPYGRFKRSQYNLLKKKYKIVMWDVLSADFDARLPAESCYQASVRNLQNGSVIVFHDNIKARDNLYYALPKVMEYGKKNGYLFKRLNDFILHP
jgi:peptidoglycan-N-acetylglucosamine deacetylase